MSSSSNRMEVSVRGKRGLAGCERWAWLLLGLMLWKWIDETSGTPNIVSSSLGAGFCQNTRNINLSRITTTSVFVCFTCLLATSRASHTLDCRLVSSSRSTITSTSHPIPIPVMTLQVPVAVPVLNQYQCSPMLYSTWNTRNWNMYFVLC